MQKRLQLRAQELEIPADLDVGNHFLVGTVPRECRAGTVSKVSSKPILGPQVHICAIPAELAGSVNRRPTQMVVGKPESRAPTNGIRKCGRIRGQSGRGNLSGDSRGGGGWGVRRDRGRRTSVEGT